MHTDVANLDECGVFCKLVPVAAYDHILLDSVTYVILDIFSPILAVIILCFRNSLRPLNRGLHPLSRFM